MNARNRIYEIVVSIACLFIGGAIYLVFRTKSLLMFSWFDSLGLSKLIDSARRCFSEVNLPYFVKYCLPNALWIISYILIVDALIPINNHRLFWTMVLPGIAIVCELLQICNLIPGTFDCGDLLCFSIPAITYFVIYKIKYHENIS